MGIRIDGSTDQISAADGSLTIEGQSINTTGIITAASFFVGSATTTASQGVNVGLGASVVSDAVNEISVYTGSVERLHIASDGKVGINQGTPEGLLHVEAGSSGASYSANVADTLILERDGACLVDIRTTAVTEGGFVFSDQNARAVGRILYDHSDNAITFGTNGSEEYLRIGSTGLVGVGTDDPSAKLEVYNGASKINVLTLRTGAGASGYAGLAFASNQTKAREKAAVYFQETNAGAHFTGDLVFAVNGTSGGATQVSSTDERLRITDGGYVGINTSTPKQELHVHDNTIYEGIFINGSAAPRVTFARGSTATVEWGVGVDGTDGSKFAIAQAGNTAKLLLTTGGNLSATGTISDSKGDVRKSFKNEQAGTYTLVAADSGKVIGAQNTVEIPPSVFGDGDMITIVNYTAGNITLTQGSGLTLYFSGDASTGNKTLATRGMATVWFPAGTTAYMSGTGIS